MDDTTIRIVRRFEAPLSRVYRAWRDPLDLADWAWGSIGRDVEADVDFRPGGRFWISTVRPDGERWAFSGTYVEIAKNERLVHTLRWTAPMGYDSDVEEVRVEFYEREGGAEILFTHRGVPTAKARQGHVEGWANTFDALADLLSRADRGSTASRRVAEAPPASTR